MGYGTMIAANRIACVCLATLVGAGLLAHQLVPQPALTEWRAAWLTLCGICFVGAVLPLAWVHDGLAAWFGDRAG